MKMYYVYYLKQAQTGALLYIGRSHDPKGRQRDFHKRYKVQTVMGICQRHSTFEAACSAELKAIARHQTSFNKKMISSPGNYGRPLSEGQKKRISQRNKGHRHTLESKAKMSATKKLNPMSQAGRESISKAARGNKNCAGRVLSEETKAKISAALVGRVGTRLGSKCSTETRAKMKAIALSRKPMSEETKAKIRTSLLGNQRARKEPILPDL